ncbi:Mitochondrial RNA pseudouridine synthase rpusd4 [Bulinus truncatus]|nr:Mitochondrial RNA pseudouridine synthase rpusd4 [Bulinus truncatus]
MSLKLRVIRLKNSRTLSNYLKPCVRVCTHNTLTQHRYFSEAPKKTYKSHTSDETVRPAEDFYGIPDSFRLQQVRVNKTVDFALTDGKENAHETRSDEILTAENSKQKTHKLLSRKDRRQLKELEMAYRTPYGIISFDTCSHDPSKINPKEHTMKVQNILDKLFLNSTTSNSSARNDVSSQAVMSKYSDLHIGSKSNFEVVTGCKLTDKHQECEERTKTGSSIDEQYFDIKTSNSSAVQDESYIKELNSFEKNRHRTLERSNSNINFNEIDEQYFGTHLEKNGFSEQGPSKHDALSKNNKNYPFQSETNKTSFNNNLNSNINEVDEQYFGTYIKTKGSPVVQDELKIQKIISLKDDSYEKGTLENKLTGSNNCSSNLNEIDNQYFGESLPNIEDTSLNIGGSKQFQKQMSNNLSSVTQNYSAFSDAAKLKENISLENSDAQIISDQQSVSSYMPQNTINSSEIRYNAFLPSDSKDTVEKVTILSSTDFLRQKPLKKKHSAVNTEETENAYDMAMKIRKNLKTKDNDIEKDTSECKNQSGASGMNIDDKSTGSTKRDSKGFKILTDQVPDLEKMTKADIAIMLKSRIIFDHEDFLAIDKPYGLPCFSQTQDRVSIMELLPLLVNNLPKSYKTSELYLVQSLDRDVTGAVILAKNPEVASNIKGMYNTSEDVIQRFWAITKGVPHPPKGLIDIPIGEGKVGKIYKMVLRPRYSKEERSLAKVSDAPSERAVTEYEVLDHRLQAALVQCTLHTNSVKHQLRVHLASGLNTPILGDHKYSHFTDLRPQKLYKEMLDMLKVRQAKVRHIALHLHCRSIILRDYKGKTIFLTTRPPQHFKHNLEALKLTVPKKLL